MDYYSLLKKSSLFKGIPTRELRDCLKDVPYHIQSYKKDEIVFHLMDQAFRIGIILEGRVEVQKSFPNGNQVSVSVRESGEMFGAAVAFSQCVLQGIGTSGKRNPRSPFDCSFHFHEGQSCVLPVMSET